MNQAMFHKINLRAVLIALVLLPAIIILLSSCVNSQKTDDTVKLILGTHPLVDKIWDVKAQQFIDKDVFLTQAHTTQYLLLGETHDNISHHLNQAEILADLSRAQRKVSVHFEMIDDKQAEQITKVGFSTVDELVRTLNNTQAGWNYDKMYRVVFEQAMQSGFKFLPANLDHDLIRTIFKEGEQHIPSAVTRVMNNVTLNDEQIKSLEKEIIEGHCNAMPDNMLAPMILTQQVRDARMTLSLLRGTGDTRVLIAGNGHTRKDRGVPLYLQSNDNRAKVVSVAFIEVEDNHLDIDDYKARWDNETLPFDYVWFTPLYDRPDPCEGLEERFNSGQK